MGKQEEETGKRLKDLAKKRESEEYARTQCIKSVFCLSLVGKR